MHDGLAVRGEVELLQPDGAGCDAIVLLLEASVRLVVCRGRDASQRATDTGPDGSADRRTRAGSADGNAEIAVRGSGGAGCEAVAYGRPKTVRSSTSSRCEMSKEAFWSHSHGFSADPHPGMPQHMRHFVLVRKMCADVDFCSRSTRYGSIEGEAA